MHLRWTDGRYPRATRAILWLVVCATATVALSFLEALTIKMAQPLTGGSDTLRWMTTRFVPPWAVFVVLLWGVRALTRWQPFDDSTRWRAIATHTTAALLFPVVHLGGVAVVDRALGMPLTFQWFRTVLSAYYVREVVLFALAAAVFHAIDLSRRARARAIAAAELKASLAEARLKVLRAQLSPHFLFNVLNAIGMLVRASRDEQALALLQQFAELLRGFLREAPSDLVTLDEELRFTERYLEIQRTRFADRLLVSIEVPADTRHLPVPHFVLYPLVENAIHHGLAGHTDEGHIAVRARREAGQLVLEVEDDGPGMAGGVPSHGAGVGLENLRGRLDHLYAARASLVLLARHPRGVLARVALPRAAGGAA